jgi:competence protein ComFB
VRDYDFGVEEQLGRTGLGTRTPRPPWPGGAGTIKEDAMELYDRDAVDFEVEGHPLRDIGNYNEYLVLEIMREVYSKEHLVCRCPVCVEDIFALSLNALPARYIQTTSLETYKGSRYFIDKDRVRAAVLNAFRTVMDNPNHGSPEKAAG